MVFPVLATPWGLCCDLSYMKCGTMYLKRHVLLVSYVLTARLGFLRRSLPRELTGPHQGVKRRNFVHSSVRPLRRHKQDSVHV